MRLPEQSLGALWLGIDDLSEVTIRDWMLTKLDRTNIYVPVASAVLIPPPGPFKCPGC